MSFAELARRGEYILSVYSTPSESSTSWELPKPRKLGWGGLTDAEIKEQAHFTNMEDGNGTSSNETVE